MPRGLLSAWDDPVVPRRRTINPLLPAESDRHHGLAYTLWLPSGGQPPAAGVLVLHGADSTKESHHGFARAAVAAGLGALTFDQRGHGESEGALGDGAVDDVVAMADLLRDRLAAPARLGLRGSSMGGHLALRAAAPCDARAVVAICPATTDGLRRGLRNGSFAFRADVDGMEALLEGIELVDVARELTVPVLIMHAEGDERVPVNASRELAGELRHPRSRLIVVPGGHHRSVQHDGDLQAVSLRFLRDALG